MNQLKTIEGCLMGGAAGDALGYPVEFMTTQEIRLRYGPEGIRSYDVHNGRALFSDDTQMALFTGAGLLDASISACGDDPTVDDFAEGINRAYLDWLITQQISNPREDVLGRTGRSWLMDCSDLYARREPGNTCLSALEAGGGGTIDRPINDSKGCGGVMRVAPIGVYLSGLYPIEFVDMVGARAAALTHGHELGYIPAAALVHIINRMAEGDWTVRQATEDALYAVSELFPAARYMDSFEQTIRRAVFLADSRAEDIAAIESIGGGWVAEEALAIAVFCATRYEDDLEQALIAAVNHSGDSDSTGAITGNILGTALGADALGRFRDGLEFSHGIQVLIYDLGQCLPGVRASHEYWRGRYSR